MLSLRIALRYFFAKKSHRAVNVISAVSAAGVAVATAAIVIVLSVFNGFSEIARRQMSLVDADLTVVPASGKVMQEADSLAARIAALPGVAVAMPSLTERGLLVAADRQLPVVFKGVTAEYPRVVPFDSIAIEGAFSADTTFDGRQPAQIAVGVAARLGNGPAAIVPDLYVPRRVGRINPAMPATAFFRAPLRATAVIQIDQVDFDADHIVIPLAEARRILGYDRAEAAAIEVAAAAGTDPGRLRRTVADALSPSFDVLTRDRLHPDTYRMISVEKWVTFLMLAFIMLIAAFNIISTISLMVIEKRDNMATLRFLGATRGMVRGIFMIQGALITLAGGVTGCIVGVLLALAQQWGGFIRLAGDPSQLTIDVYPVQVLPRDILAVMGLVALVALLAALSSRLFTRNLKQTTV